MKLQQFIFNNRFKKSLLNTTKLYFSVDTSKYIRWITNRNKNIFYNLKVFFFKIINQFFITQQIGRSWTSWDAKVAGKIRDWSTDTAPSVWVQGCDIVSMAGQGLRPRHTKQKGGVRNSIENFSSTIFYKPFYLFLQVTRQSVQQRWQGS